MSMPKEDYSPAAQKILGYMMSHPFDRVSLLTRIPSEVKATLQAMYSRNDLPMRDTLLKTVVTIDLGLNKKDSKRKFDEVTPEEKEAVYEKYAANLPDYPPLYNLFDNRAREFLGEFAVKHGHNSIKEGAFISYVVEGVSIITAKALENDPLFHGQELSTRYKSFAKQKVPLPSALAKSIIADELQKYFELSLPNYLHETQAMNDYQQKTFPKPADISPQGWKQVLNAATFDNARYLLNAGITTQLGIVEDARTLERKLRNMLVFPFGETREVAKEIIEKAKIELPTLITHVEPNNYLKETEFVITLLQDSILGKGTRSAPASRVQFLHATHDLENKLVANILYAEGRHDHSWQNVYDKVKTLTAERKKQVLQQVFERLGRHDEPVHTLRGARIAFEIFPDFGAWRDIQRHRRCNQTFPLPTCNYGYDTPWLVKEAGLEKHYNEHMERTAEMFEKARKISPEEAVIVPALGFRVKQTVDADIEELVYMWWLRTTEHGHFSYRQIFIEAFEQAKQHIPLLAEIIEDKKLITKGDFRHGRLVEEKRYEEKKRQAE